LSDALDQKGYFRSIEIVGIVYQILEALDYLSSNDIIHGDIKLENILFVDSTKKRVKLIDFGFSSVGRKIKQKGDCLDGTAEYFSPEMIEGSSYNFQTDMWSLGVLVYTLLMGYLPYEEEDQQELYQAIIKIEFPKKYRWFKLEADVRGFIESLLTTEEKRMTASMALRHPWIKRLLH